jgi:hypothetical protein
MKEDSAAKVWIQAFCKRFLNSAGLSVFVAVTVFVKTILKMYGVS